MLQRQIHEREDARSLQLMPLEIMLRYMAFHEEDLEEELLSTQINESLETILSTHPNKKAEISNKLDDAEATEALNEFLEEERKVKLIYYQPTETEENLYEEENGDGRYVEKDRGSIYIIEDKLNKTDYLFVPRGITVYRVPQNVLGENVLGRTWLGTGVIEILDHLFGDAFQEVLQHELNHQLYPHENEGEIRARTRKQLQYPIFH